MAVLKLAISSARDDGTLEQWFETVGGNREIGNRIVNYLTSLLSGSELAMSSSIPPQIAISIQENEVQASATLTLTSVIATDAFVINGVTFTGVASGATGNQFNIGVDDDATAANIVTSVNASVTALVANYVTASAVANVVTITSDFYGTSGNQATLVSNDGTIVASAARLGSGAADATAQTLQF